MSVEEKLKSLNIDLSNPPKAVGSYAAYKLVGKNVYISGQLPIDHNGNIIKGKVGDNLSIKDSLKASYLCGINIIKQLNLACNSNLLIVKNCIKITGYINSVDNFTEQPKIINPVSELIVQIFDQKGVHARAAVSVNSLPLGVPVEVDAIFEIN